MAVFERFSFQNINLLKDLLKRKFIKIQQIFIKTSKDLLKHRNLSKYLLKCERYQNILLNHEDF